MRLEGEFKCETINVYKRIYFRGDYRSQFQVFGKLTFNLAKDKSISFLTYSDKYTEDGEYRISFVIENIDSVRITNVRMLKK